MSNPTQQEQQEIEAQKVQSLLAELIGVSREYDLNAVLLATESLLVWRATSEGVPLQNLMDNLFQNVPTMYTLNVQAQAQTQQKIEV